MLCRVETSQDAQISTTLSAESAPSIGREDPDVVVTVASLIVVSRRDVARR
jgi:hypothetical protein